MAEERGWLRRNWTTPVILLAIFLVALFLRAYFPWGPAVQDRLLSGGSDSYYYERIVDTCVETGKQLTFDGRLNYPMGLMNPRPPLFSWTICVAGKAISPFYPSEWAGVTVAFLSSTALWGALTVFPMYFLTKEAFGRRAALLAAFFLSIMPANLQRSPATVADHDAMVLFFVVAGFFFFLKSLKSLQEKRWVEDWSFWKKAGRASIWTGLRAGFRENRTASLYALLSGWSLAAIALIWQGWAYAPVILLVYFLFQVLIHRLRSQDPTGIVAMFAIAVGLPLLVSFPWYYTMGQIKVWYDVPLYLYLAALALGIVFTVTRDYPWALVVPVVIGVSGVLLVVLSIVYPGVATAFVSGAGYFVQTKAYSTIAEAQPPGLSQVILSFGVTTYFFALFGLLWMARGIPRHPTPDYLFAVVWAIAAIFMAQSAARFIFNASPAFAMASAWVTILFLNWLRFDDMRKTFRSLGGSRLTAFRRSVKPRHVIGSLLVLVILLVPNVWFGIDASIPYEEKPKYDEQVYNAYPSFLRPADYTTYAAQGSTYYFGAFGYSLPLEKEYWPAAWRWLSSQDADVLPAENRPAFLSWWDYGFEAVDAGAHPTVADNFLDGYQLAGNFITAQSEADAIGLLDLRLLEGNFYKNGHRFSDGVRATLTSLGIPWRTLEDVFEDPAPYVSIVDGDPLKYGHHETLQLQNAKYIYAGGVLNDALDANGLADLGHALRKETGASIRYFAVDTRLFPLTGTNTGIFYAPVKLSDHRILNLRDGRSIPIDFFNIIATTQRGSVNVADLQTTDQVTAYTLDYKDMFYNSMFYRAYAGFSPTVAGQSCTDCIPGLSGSTNTAIANIQPMPAWNLTHFRLAYRTAYYNPYPSTDIANHTDAWQAMDYAAAIELQAKINRGEAIGVVDASAGSSMRRGVVFLKYYDGAYLNGTVRLGGVPWPGVQVTVADEFGVPHDAAVTDAGGRYSLVVPFGDLTVQASIGRPDNRTLVGPTVLGTATLTVSDAAAMREDVDVDGNGYPDWLITRDIDVEGETFDGHVYLDANRNGARDAGETALGNSNLTLARMDGALARATRTASDGHAFLESLYPGAYNATVTWEGRTLVLVNVTIAKGQGTLDLGVKPSVLQGRVLDAAGHRMGGASVTITDATNGTSYRATAASDALFAFTTLLPGTFDIEASLGTMQSMPDQASIRAIEESVNHNVTVYPSGTVALHTNLGGAPQGFITVAFEQRSTAQLLRMVTSDARGEATVTLPSGTWDVHSRHFADSNLWAFIGALTVRPGTTASYTVGLGPGATVGGVAFNKDNRTEALGNAEILVRGAEGELRLAADVNGRFLTHLPLGTWVIQASTRNLIYNEPWTITGDASLELGASTGVLVSGDAYRTFPENETVQIENPLPDALVTFYDATHTYETITGFDGKFQIALPGSGSFAFRVDCAGYLPYEDSARSPFDWQGSARAALVARNVTVSGRLLQDGSLVTDPTVPVVFHALGPGALQAYGSLDGMGGYTASLSPGRYSVLVNRDLSGNGSIRMQLKADTPLTVDVGSDTIPLDLDLVVRYRVDGTVALDGSPRSPVVRFEGPDVRTANATGGDFTTYLVAGSYTVLANLTESANTYLAIQPLHVMAPATVALQLRLATNVTGSVRYAGSPVSGVVISFSLASGEIVNASSDAFGQYYAYLLGGSYSVTVDHAATAQQGAGVKYVRYTFSGTLEITDGSRFAVFAVDVGQTLDNTTLAGTVRYKGSPAAAGITFIVTGANGLNATVDAGPDGQFAVAMQPGTYEVYAFAPLERAAYLGAYTLAAGGAPRLDLALVDALRVSGVTTVRGSVRTAANLTFTSPAGVARFRSDGVGAYEAFLPAANYTVEATAYGTERDVSVTYRATSDLTLTQASVLNLALQKVVRRGVDVTWDASEQTTIHVGETVDYHVTVRNTGNEDDTLLVSATTIGFAFSFSDDKLDLPFGSPGNETTVRVTITANADASVDHGPISLTVRSNTDSSSVKSVVLELGIERYRGLTADVSSAAPTWDGRYLNYTLEIYNTGNSEETFRLSLPNLDDLAALGWKATLVPPSGAASTSLELVVPANTTQTPKLRLEYAGGASGTLARIFVVNADDAQYASLVTVNVQMPSLAASGAVRVSGGDTTLQAPGIDLAAAAFLIAFVAVIAAVAYLVYLRRQSR